MKDRVPVNPGRVLITPENGAAAFYATMNRADNPTQEGDPLNKNTLLKDATAALYGLPNTAVPDEVFALIKQAINSLIENSKNVAKIETGSYVGTSSGLSHSITFSFAPKLVIIYGFSGTSAVDSLAIIPCLNLNSTHKMPPYLYCNSGTAMMPVSKSDYIYATLVGKTLTIGIDLTSVSVSRYGKMMLTEGNTYHYIAIA